MKQSYTYRKPLPLSGLPGDWGPWTAAYFANPDSRNRFVDAVAAIEASDFEAAAIPDQAKNAWVRWRPHRFLGLNDIAYAHGGRITR